MASMKPSLPQQQHVEGVFSNETTTTKVVERQKKNWKDPSVYRFTNNDHDAVSKQHPNNECDYRNIGGPLLSYIWCTTATNVLSSSKIRSDDDADDADSVAAQCVIGDNKEQLKYITTTVVDDDDDAAAGTVTATSNCNVTISNISNENSIDRTNINDDKEEEEMDPNSDERTDAISATAVATAAAVDNNHHNKNNNNQLKTTASIPTQSILHGQNLYLGAEVSTTDGCMYCIPGHADRVLQINPHVDNNSTSTIPPPTMMIQVGPKFIGKYKWLRGVECSNTGVIYGLPCHADTVLKIDVRNNCITELYIHYEDFFTTVYHNNYTNDNTTNATDSDCDSNSMTAAHIERHREWKYHGGNISPIDGCIYTIPQSAEYVLQINPTTDHCTLVVGPKLAGKYKFYGGVIGKQDGAIYGIPHNSLQILRIHPVEGITLHGHDALMATTTTATDGTGSGGNHKWHGGAAAPNGVIVCVPANADTVLCITPVASSPPIITLIGNAQIIQSGRHRSDRKYKYLGATAGPDGRVYCFPCAAEYVLAVDTVRMTVHQIGPNLYDTNMERLCQNKWQNGVYLPEHNCIFGIPLAAESVLRIDFNQLDHRGDPTISTWPIPFPHQNMGKWEGAVVVPPNNNNNDGVAFCIPNNHKASLRIEMSSVSKKPLPDTLHASATTTTTIIDGVALGTTSSSGVNSQSEQQVITTTSVECSTGIQSPAASKLLRDRPDYSHRDDLIYKSGIPTLRASAHRVKFSPKNRTHDPCPKNRNGIDTGTLWLPIEVRREDVFSYDSNTEYNFTEVLSAILERCDTDIVGAFRNGSKRLEDFIVNPKSIWRTVNGGQCEHAQQYLSSIVSTDEQFLAMFDNFVTKVVLPYLKQRIIAVLPKEGTDDYQTPSTMTFYYQRPPTVRLQPGPAWAQVKAHNDAEYGHQYGELNFWVPLTSREQTGVDLYCESSYEANDYRPIPAMIGEAISFHGSSCRHYVNTNASESTRVSFDFRVGVQGFFDPDWEMKALIIEIETMNAPDNNSSSPNRYTPSNVVNGIRVEALSIPYIRGALYVQNNFIGSGCRKRICCLVPLGLFPTTIYEFNGLFDTEEARSLCAIAVRESDNTVVGFAWMTDNTMKRDIFMRILHHINDGECYIESMGVLPECRGQGIGTRMLKYCEDRAKQRPAVTELTLGVVANNPAKRLYERFGFVGNDEHNNDGRRNCCCMAMRAIKLFFFLGCPHFGCGDAMMKKVIVE